MVKDINATWYHEKDGTVTFHIACIFSGSNIHPATIQWYHHNREVQESYKIMMKTHILSERDDDKGQKYKTELEVHTNSKRLDCGVLNEHSYKCSAKGQAGGQETRIESDPIILTG